MLTTWDRGLIAVTLAMAALSFLFLPKAIGAGSGAGEKLVIVQSGPGTIQKYPLKADKNLVVKNGDGFCRIQIKGDRVRVTDSNCPKHICRSRGWINGVGQSIVCLPHQTIVTISSVGSQPIPIDAVVR
ncbi:MAG TPA: NusG domain II-containing protein [Actinobacteria bacterium]|nr:NusG domain II-containing protein [Actinomycetota bacterium]